MTSRLVTVFSLLDSNSRSKKNGTSYNALLMVSTWRRNYLASRMERRIIWLWLSENPPFWDRNELPGVPDTIHHIAWDNATKPQVLCFLMWGYTKGRPTGLSGRKRVHFTTLSSMPMRWRVTDSRIEVNRFLNRKTSPAYPEVTVPLECGAILW